MSRTINGESRARFHSIRPLWEKPPDVLHAYNSPNLKCGGIIYFTNPNALTFPSQLSFLGSLIEAAPWQTRLMPTSYREDTFICLPPSTICPIFSDSAYIRQGVGQNKHWGHSKLIVQNCANLSTLRSLTFWWMSLHWLRRNSCSRSCTQRVHMFLLN